MILTNKTPNGNIIKFDSDKHLYTCKDKKLISVTQLIKKYSKPFETDKLAKKQAIETGYTIDEVKKVWDDLREAGSYIGDKVHTYLLFLLSPTGNETKVYPDNKDEEDYFSQARQLAKYILKWYNVVSCERIIGSYELGIAGMVDLILEHKTNKLIYVTDFKTGKDILKSNRFEKFLSPINYIENCTYNKYSLQLSIYKSILQREKYFNIYDDRLIIWYITKSKFYEYKAIDMDIEVYKLFKQEGMIV